jgi:hypothetical protein
MCDMAVTPDFAAKSHVCINEYVNYLESFPLFEALVPSKRYVSASMADIFRLELTNKLRPSVVDTYLRAKFWQFRSHEDLGEELVKFEEVGSAIIETLLDAPMVPVPFRLLLRETLIHLNSHSQQRTTSVAKLDDLENEAVRIGALPVSRSLRQAKLLFQKP